MADIFISFSTADTARVRPIYDALKARGLSLFWSNDIPTGAPDYHAIIKDELRKARLVIVVWTLTSIDSHPVSQECSQAERSNKLIQVLIDDIEPIDFPMEVRFRAQKTILIGWDDNPQHPEWVRLNEVLDKRLGRGGSAPLAEPPVLSASAALAEPIEFEVGAVRRQIVPGSGSWFRDLPEGPEMVVVPAGEYLMGSDDGAQGPQHRVRIAKPFAIGRFTVTVGEFTAFVEAIGHPIPNRMSTTEKGVVKGNLAYIQETRENRSFRNPGFPQSPRHPVVGVSWEDAKAYAGWLTKRTGKLYRLPSEAEWEYVARAGSTTSFWWGASISTAQANYDGNFTLRSEGPGEFRMRTLPVETFDSNPWGLYQVHGNVWEWCEDCWHRSYRGAPEDGTAWTGFREFLIGFLLDDFRVVRGGCWFNAPSALRSAYRASFNRFSREDVIGFRVARSL